ncbi:2-oxoadipate dioxygenase/decarboxylase family protein [Streptomyces sp. BRA346]|uniref:2-oxoadipate dioxygenase/decarboxylase family protein n=1 Tax=Streptomyces sp. BRA346 TaxID=2878199 RepID=UPI0040629F8D
MRPGPNCSSRRSSGTASTSSSASPATPANVLYDVFARHTDAPRHILARDERHAGYMADGYARTHRRIGVCEASSGGGAVYLAGDLGEAYASSVPVLAITTWRHAAIRVATPGELRRAGQIFAALGMCPVGAYAPGDAAARPAPVVSTLFRPVAPGDLARAPFRVFTSVLVPGDRRPFTAERPQRDFPPELLRLAARAEAELGLPPEGARRFLDLATAAFRPSGAPVDLTPRVLDLDELHRRMADRGVAMTGGIQGPPHWDGPDVLPRRTSFGPRCAVEARGIALTPAGRARYDAMTAETDRLLAIDPVLSRQEAAAKIWAMCLPATEAALARQDLAYFTYHATDPATRRRDGLGPPAGLAGLLHGGWITAEPIVYEDVLPRPVADPGTAEPPLDADWPAGVLDRPVADPMEHYARQRRDSLDEAARALGIAPIAPPPPPD